MEPAVTVDTDLIPEEAGKRFGHGIIDEIREYLKQPGAMEELEARTKARLERRKAHETALSPV